MKRLAIWLLVALLTLPMLGQGHVLCIGEDGHISLESSLDCTCCAESHDACDDAPDAVVASSAVVSECSDCMDIAIGAAANTDRVARDRSASQHIAQVATALAAPFQPVCDKSACLSARQPCLARPPIAHLRTVSLLV